MLRVGRNTARIGKWAAPNLLGGGAAPAESEWSGWSDTFDALDAGWSSTYLAVTGGCLTRTGGGGYQVCPHACGGDVPASHRVTFTFPASFLLRHPYFGVAVAVADGAGVGVMYDGDSNRDEPRFPLALSAPFDAQYTVSGAKTMPASWASDEDPHTIAFAVDGSGSTLVVTVYFDGLEYGTITTSIASTDGLGVAVLGDDNQTYCPLLIDSITIEAL